MSTSSTVVAPAPVNPTPADAGPRVESIVFTVGEDRYPVNIIQGADKKTRVADQAAACRIIVAYGKVSERIPKIKAAQRKTAELVELGYLPNADVTINLIQTDADAVESTFNRMSAIMANSTGFTVPVGESSMSPAAIIRSKKELLKDAVSGARGMLAALSRHSNA